MILEKDQDMKKEHDILKSCQNIDVQCGQNVHKMCLGMVPKFCFQYHAN